MLAPGASAHHTYTMPETPLMSPRSAAIEQYRSGAYGQVPDAPEDTLSPEEAKLFLESIKPERYAALASVIDVVLSTAFDQRAARLSKGKGGLLKAPPSEWGEPDDPWIALSADFSATLRAGQKSIPHDALKTADEYVQLVSDIDPERHIKISTQLTAGINTASTTMTNLLRNMPHIITRYHETAAAEDFPDIARNSLSLVGRLALGCVNRLMAAREGLTKTRPAAGSASLPFWTRIILLLDARRAGLLVSTTLTSKACMCRIGSMMVCAEFPILKKL